MTDGTPISDYGLLSDTRTAALVASDGAMDWLCVPRFDGDPLFGRLVGGTEAGTFRVGPAGPATVVERRYRQHTATLETTWAVGGGRLRLTEAMVAEVSGRLLPATLIVRRLSAEQAEVDAVVEFDPRLGERHRRPRAQHRRQALVCEWGALAVALDSTPRFRIEPGRPSSITVRPGRPVTLVLAVAHREPLIHVEPTAAWDLLVEDEARWRAWTAEIDERLPFREHVVRSLLTLRLLTYSPSGAPVAAPTTSLPEDPGGERNWDYRYVWPRDASIGVSAFLSVGKTDEARGFLAWLLHASRLQRPRLPALLTVHGRHVPAERELAGWPGYLDSRPVRVGNDAAGQHQLDGYGWVIDAAWAFAQAGHRLYAETWRAVRGFADVVADCWQQPDAGIWEVREPAQHVHSKLMGWLALDRALAIADTHPLRRINVDAGRTPVTPSPPRSGRAASTRRRPATSAGTAPGNSTLPCSSCRCWAWTGPGHSGYGAPSTPSGTGCPPAVHCSTATRPGATGSPAPRARSYPARSGSFRALPAPDVAARPSSCSRPWSTTPARSASTPKR